MVDTIEGDCQFGTMWIGIVELFVCSQWYVEGKSAESSCSRDP
jgi:hypothetical protein